MFCHKTEVALSTRERQLDLVSLTVASELLQPKKSEASLPAGQHPQELPVVDDLIESSPSTIESLSSLIESLSSPLHEADLAMVVSATPDITV